MKKLIYILLFILPISACQNKEGVKLPNEVRWVTQSIEYSSVCEQIYNSASSVLQNQFEGLDRPIIVMDLDETVLNNVQYQVELFEKSETYNPTSWNAWVNKELATAVPGAKSFILNFKEKYEGRIVFISNRDASTIKATRNNLDNLGLLFEDDVFLLRKDKRDTKIVRRNEVLEGIGRMQSYGPNSVIAYFGDQIGDFRMTQLLYFL
ncbi:MAG: hypothetical protein CM15mP23_01780 [Cryomorphaceae bacterium]|nr:MAG: hypothetical protein CM15mP23_01780 [Cryomorphaceae bacterium]